MILGQLLSYAAVVFIGLPMAIKWMYKTGVHLKRRDPPAPEIDYYLAGFGCWMIISIAILILKSIWYIKLW